MLELDWPEFGYEDPRWKIGNLGRYTLSEENSSTGLQTYWSVNMEVLPNERTKYEMIKGESARKIEELTYSTIPGIHEMSPLIRCHLTRLIGGSKHSLSVNSAGYVWRELEFSDRGSSTNLETNYSPEGTISECKITTTTPEAKKVYTANFSLLDLSDGWIGYNVSYSEIDLDIGKFLEELKNERVIKLEIPALRYNILAEDRKRLGEEINIFGGLIFLVNQDIQTGEIKLEVTRKSEQNKNQFTISMARMLGDTDSLLNEACLSGSNDWESIIQKVVLRVD